MSLHETFSFGMYIFRSAKHLKHTILQHCYCKLQRSLAFVFTFYIQSKHRDILTGWQPNLLVQICKKNLINHINKEIQVKVHSSYQKIYRLKKVLNLILFPLHVIRASLKVIPRSNIITENLKHHQREISNHGERN